jgi:hypothetical protein
MKSYIYLSPVRKILLFLFICIGTCLSAREGKTTLRALVACDLISENIRDGSAADLSRMKKTLASIAKQLGVASKITVLQKGSLTVPKVKKWLSSLQEKSNDIVFFYYSGHGGRVGSSQGPWPFIVCPRKGLNKPAKVLMGKTVYKQISKKNPRLGIIMFDSCNNRIQRKSPQILPPHLTLDFDNDDLPGLKQLFLDQRGIIISSAASPGEVAVTAIRGPVLGGIFTTGFLFSLKYYAKNPNASWNDVLSGATLFCQKFYQGRQNPRYIIKPD